MYVPVTKMQAAVGLSFGFQDYLQLKPNIY